MRTVCPCSAYSRNSHNRILADNVQILRPTAPRTPCSSLFTVFTGALPSRDHCGGRGNTNDGDQFIGLSPSLLRVSHSVDFPDHTSLTPQSKWARTVVASFTGKPRQYLDIHRYLSKDELPHAVPKRSPKKGKLRAWGPRAQSQRFSTFQEAPRSLPKPGK